MAGLAGADPYRLLQGQDEYLAVADLPGLPGSPDRFDHLLDGGFIDSQFELHFGDKLTVYSAPR